MLYDAAYRSRYSDWPRGWTTDKLRFRYSRSVPTASGNQPASYLRVAKSLSSEVKRTGPEADNLSLPRCKNKKDWSYHFTPVYAVMAYTGATAKGQRILINIRFHMDVFCKSSDNITAVV